jgi:hypothetical protein
MAAAGRKRDIAIRVMVTAKEQAEIMRRLGADVDRHRHRRLVRRFPLLGTWAARQTSEASSSSSGGPSRSIGSSAIS